MPFPQSLMVRPLGLAAAGGGASGGGGATGGGGPVAAGPLYPPFVMQQQVQTNWCWAAVSTSVGLFFANGAWTQCSVATTAIPSFPSPPAGPFDCCSNGGPCNIYGYLDVALTTTQSFNSMQSSTLGWGDLQGQITATHVPVCVRVAWNSGGAHFLAIVGWRVDSFGNQYIQVADPGTGSISTQPFNGPTPFPSTYNGGATWTHTYLTQNQAP